jgi:hypothetical protein
MIAITRAQKRVGTSCCDVPRKLSGQRDVPAVTWIQLVIALLFACSPLDVQKTRAAVTAEDRRSQTAATIRIAADTAATTEGKTAFVFGGVDYFHRWSQNDQHEFTPQGQEDLEKWSDMITMNVYPSAHDGDALAVRANAALENYKNHGARVLRTNSVPRMPDRPAEHFIAVVFGRPNFIEVAFARFKLVDGVGCSIVYSHRIYGAKVGDQMSAWLNQNGAKTEKALMEWNAIPSPSSLRELPRAESRPSDSKTSPHRRPVASPQTAMNTAPSALD